MWAAGINEGCMVRTITLDSRRVFHNQARRHSLCSLEIPGICFHFPMPAGPLLFAPVLSSSADSQSCLVHSCWAVVHELRYTELQEAIRGGCEESCDDWEARSSHCPEHLKSGSAGTFAQRLNCK